MSFDLSQLKEKVAEAGMTLASMPVRTGKSERFPYRGFIDISMNTLLGIRCDRIKFINGAAIVDPEEFNLKNVLSARAKPNDLNVVITFKDGGTVKRNPDFDPYNYAADARLHKTNFIADAPHKGLNTSNFTYYSETLEKILLNVENGLKVRFRLKPDSVKKILEKTRSDFIRMIKHTRGTDLNAPMTEKDRLNDAAIALDQARRDLGQGT